MNERMTRLKRMTSDEMAEELYKRELLEEAEKRADSKYAVKLVQNIVFGALALIFVAAVGLFINAAFHSKATQDVLPIAI